VVHGDFVYVCTGNGRWMGVTAKKPFYPLAPSLVAFNKKTGQLVARDDEQIGERLWRGQYSSPSMGVVGNKEQIYFGAGDGTCYAFEPVAPNTQVAPNRWVTTTLRGPIVQFISAGKTKTESQVQPTPASALPVETRYAVGSPVCSPLDTLPTAQVPDVPILRKIWWFDCIPKEYRKTPFYAYDAKSDGKGRPCEIMATPVFYRNRVYVAIGGDPRHGGRDSKGNLVCIDATKTGDITKTGEIWHYDKINQCASTVAIADGLVYALDESGVIHCLDADTGKCYWTYTVIESHVESTSSSLLVADGKVFVGKNILVAGKELKPLATELIAAPIYSTPCVANGVIFTLQGKWLYAICEKGDKP
jgi:outer membrane protein assembly factor BamB